MNARAVLRKEKARPGRNNLCSCGSGRKFKKCCGQLSEAAAAESEDRGQPAGPGSLSPPELSFLEACVEGGHYAQLEGRVRGLLAADSRRGALWKLLALSLGMQGKDALQALRNAAILLPADAETHNNLGSVLQQHGQPEEALASYRRATALASNFVVAHHNLGNALYALGRPAEAVECFRRALELKPNDAELHTALGNGLFDLGRTEDAAASYRRALKITPTAATLHCSLALALSLQNQTAAAEESCQRALQIDPQLTAALVLRANLRVASGRLAEADELLSGAHGVDPEAPEVCAALVQRRALAGGDDAWLARAQHIVGRRLPPQREVPLRYALGKYFDDIRNFEQAFSNYRRANELMKQSVPRFEAEQMTRHVDRLILTCDREWLEQRRISAAGSERAVFIVGMPRSGTSLTEQILASHPDVHGAGELGYWTAAAGQYEQPLREAGASTDDGLGRASGEFLALLRELSPDAAFVIDKACANFLHLGVIHAALPGARIIHMQRDPLDTCLSIYFHSFPQSHRHANDLGDLAHYYAEYRRVMEHWRRVLPQSALLEVPYEELVDRQESWTRRMLEYLGLPWNPRCLDFHTTQRTVATASKWQVRQRITRGSIGRWRNYEKFIAPLRGLAR